jgi:hypothetical protein
VLAEYRTRHGMAHSHACLFAYSPLTFVINLRPIPTLIEEAEADVASGDPVM